MSVGRSIGPPQEIHHLQHVIRQPDLLRLDNLSSSLLRSQTTIRRHHHCCRSERDQHSWPQPSAPPLELHIPSLFTTLLKILPSVTPPGRSKRELRRLSPLRQPRFEVDVRGSRRPELEQEADIGFCEGLWLRIR
ncbi:hypothetical protein BHE74_00005775 [Ensete ventricosum]|uniref:Uncharacterized protein n=1 Tax=Ensete ventricosum TaxID=4639 RepID=A0A444FXF0_ENSVE|nr:hypothetical protein GW17_00008301 [Ensete ventricosum]RWW85532.1 hypothetical protein BHE74_00005775 [Ensete ventricosum]RZR70980.1 hypothetical protein BHM03_00002581 [Ensete ventricosum]